MALQVKKKKPSDKDSLIYLTTAITIYFFNFFFEEFVLSRFSLCILGFLASLESINHLLQVSYYRGLTVYIN